VSDSKVGLANPYAIAEIAIGRKVNWKAIKNHDAFIEKTLGVSIEKLVAPVPGNPFVSGSPDSKKALSDLQPMKSDVRLPSARCALMIASAFVSGPRFLR
jgi:hypothetical protein